MSGFTYYDDPFTPGSTTAEILANLSAQHKTSILTAFCRRVRPDDLRHKLMLPKGIITHLNAAIKAVENRARALMREEILITPATMDEEAIYNIRPANAAALLSAVQDDFVDDFTVSEVNAILTNMVKYSKWDGSGTWTYYKNAVIK